MQTSGLRGRCSPMNDATPEQTAKVADLLAECRARGVQRFGTRYSPYIGPGCAATREAILVETDGFIYGHVEQDGRVTL